MSESRWWVYMVETEQGRLYTGVTTDLQRRFDQHRDGSGASFFRFDAARRMVFQEAAQNRGAAQRREAEIKRLSKAAKQALVDACQLQEVIT